MGLVVQGSPQASCIVPESIFENVIFYQKIDNVIKMKINHESMFFQSWARQRTAPVVLGSFCITWNRSFHFGELNFQSSASYGSSDSSLARQNSCKARMQSCWAGSVALNIWPKFRFFELTKMFFWKDKKVWYIRYNTLFFWSWDFLVMTMRFSIKFCVFWCLQISKFSKIENCTLLEVSFFILC